MVEWWARQDMHDLAGIVVVLLVVLLVFNVVEMIYDWLTYKVKIAYLKAAEKEQIETYAILVEVKETIKLIRGYAELVRIQASNVAHMNKEVKGQVDENTARLEQKIDKVPKKVVDELDKKDSGIHAKRTDQSDATG